MLLDIQSPAGLFWQVELYGKLQELLNTYLFRSLGQGACGLLSLWEGNNIPDGVDATHKHYQSVKSQGNAAVGRGAVLQGLQHEAKLVLRLIILKPEDPKYLLLQVIVMNADAATTNLVAI